VNQWREHPLIWPRIRWPGWGKSAHPRQGWPLHLSRRGADGRV